MTKAEVRREQKAIVLKIALLVPVLVAAFLLLCTLKAQAREKYRPTSFAETLEYGPSQSFLIDYGETRTYLLITNGERDVRKVYASGVLDDGTIVYACEDYMCIAIRPDGVLVEGYWGNFNGFEPRNAYSRFSFREIPVYEGWQSDRKVEP